MASDNTAAPTPEPAPLAVVQRARDSLIAALAVTAMPDAAHLEALRDLSDECQRRAGASQPNALDRLLFVLRRRQAAIERRIAAVRREHGR